MLLGTVQNDHFGGAFRVERLHGLRRQIHDVLVAEVYNASIFVKKRLERSKKSIS